jgi:hypothetical protein
MTSPKPRHRPFARPAAILIAVLAAILVPQKPAAAAPLADFFARPAALRPSLGVLFGLNLDSNSKTSHLITSNLGCGLEYPLGSGFSFEPNLGAYWNYYELSASGRAVPTEISEGYIYAFGLLVDLPLVYTLRLGDRFSLAAGAGLCLHSRLGIKSLQSVEDDYAASVNSYFWSAGRFFLPSSLLRLEYRLNEKISVGLGGKFLWPIFNLWAGENLSFFDQSLIDASMSFRYRLR